MLALAPDDSRRPQLWRFRGQDLLRILDNVDLIEEAMPLFRGRIDRTRIAVAGHSWGCQKASTLLWATHPRSEMTERRSIGRMRASRRASC